MGRKDKYILGTGILLAGSAVIIAIIMMCYIVIFGGRPHISIQQLHIREDSINPSNPNTSFVVDLKFKKINIGGDIFLYSDLNIILYCVSDRSFFVLGNCVIPGFYQYSWNKMVHQEAMVVPRGPSWDDAQWKIGQGSTVGLRVEMTTGFRRCVDSESSSNCLYTKPKAVVVEADFLLDGSGDVLKIH